MPPSSPLTRVATKVARRNKTKRIMINAALDGGNCVKNKILAGAGRRMSNLARCSRVFGESHQNIHCMWNYPTNSHDVP